MRDYGLLASAAARPGTTVFGADAYPTLVEKAAALLESLIGNHALVDGNERLGRLATATFLFLNGYDTVDDDTMFDLVITIADGTVTGVDAITKRLEPLLIAC